MYVRRYLENMFPLVENEAKHKKGGSPQQETGALGAPEHVWEEGDGVRLDSSHGHTGGEGPVHHAQRRQHYTTD